MDDAALCRFQYRYLPETGEWGANNSPNAKRKGTVDPRDGCLYLMFKGRQRRASQMAWLYVKGEWPSRQVHYIDPDLPLPVRDAFSNLRLAGAVETPTKERLDTLFRVEPDTGNFWWRVKRRGVNPDRPAGSVKHIQGRHYRYVRIDGVDYLAHQLMWLHVYGEWPKARLTFRNGNQLDCWSDNLVEGEFAHGTRRDKPLAPEDRQERSNRKYRKHDLKRDFGLTVEQYQEMFNAQGGRCAICNQIETSKSNQGLIKALSVDHNHTTGAVRELLCNNCNMVLGAACDRIDILEAAIAYLRRHERAEEAA